MLIASVVLCLLGGGTASAAGKKGGCKWANTMPNELTKKQARAAVHCLTNAQRREHGLSTLRYSKRLERAAVAHNREMVGTGCFAHECPGEPAVVNRLREVGYILKKLVYWAFGENLAWGERERGTPQAVTDALFASPGHRENILNPKFRHIGIAFHKGTPASADVVGGVYTIEFGTRKN